MAEPTTGFPELDEALRETKENPDPLISGEPKTAQSKRGAARSPSQPRKPTTRSISVRAARVMGVFGAGIDLIDRDGFCGNHLMDSAEDFGEAVELAAKENPKIQKWVEESIESAALINLFIVVAGIMAPIAQHHIRPRRRQQTQYYVPESEAGFAGEESPVTESGAPIVPENGSAAATGGLPWSAKSGESFPL